MEGEYVEIRKLEEMGYRREPGYSGSIYVLSDLMNNPGKKPHVLVGVPADSRFKILLESNIEL
jgi:hypothetical protein